MKESNIVGVKSWVEKYITQYKITIGIYESLDNNPIASFVASYKLSNLREQKSGVAPNQFVLFNDDLRIAFLAEHKQIRMSIFNGKAKTNSNLKFDSFNELCGKYCLINGDFISDIPYGSNIFSPRNDMHQILTENAKSLSFDIKENSTTYNKTLKLNEKLVIKIDENCL